MFFIRAVLYHIAEYLKALNSKQYVNFLITKSCCKINVFVV